MNQEDRDRPDKAAKASEDAKSGKTERDAANKAVLDNMARLKALRLAREAAEPQRAPATKARKSTPAAKRTNEKPVALSDWLASQQNGGRRT